MAKVFVSGKLQYGATDPITEKVQTTTLIHVVEGADSESVLKVRDALNLLQANTIESSRMVATYEFD